MVWCSPVRCGAPSSLSLDDKSAQRPTRASKWWSRSSLLGWDCRTIAYAWTSRSEIRGSTVEGAIGRRGEGVEVGGKQRERRGTDEGKGKGVEGGL